VDATDVARGIFRVRQVLPIPGPGHLTLLYPEWLPGYHAPASDIELLGGLEIWADGVRVDWRRDPVRVHAFHLDAPPGVAALDLTFQFLSPTNESQGDICVTPALLALRWGAMVLYPAGYFSRQIRVKASVLLPPEWRWACALDAESSNGSQTTFKTTSLDVMVDSPLLAGRHFRRIDLDGAGRVWLNLAADHAEQLEATDEQIEPHRAMVREMDALMGSRPFERFEFLVAVSDELGGGGVEHRSSCEIVAPSSYFTAWDANSPSRDVFAHEYGHAWNGKLRRGADSWTPSFDRPIRNSLMWVYEGMTQYWGEVLAVRSGLWTPQQALDTLARTAAIYSSRPGGCWRPLIDTTRDPIIVRREPLPWPSWQRSEDYYAEGQLLWLDVDTLIRELTGEARALDDVAKAFFGVADGSAPTLTYEFEDVVAALNDVAPHDWGGFIASRLEAREVGAPLGGLERGGYRLVYRDTPSDFAVVTDAPAGVVNLRFSIGLTVSSDGSLQEVIWDSPAFEAELVPGDRLVAVNGRAFNAQALNHAVAETERCGAVTLLVQHGKRAREAVVLYHGGHRYPRLEPIPGARRRLDEILTSRAPAAAEGPVE
jgi:predicted metalloprotease with PDZ domain